MASRTLKATETRLHRLRVYVEKELALISGGDESLELSIGRKFADDISPKAEGRAYHESVFINCPFDPEYRALFDAAVFAVIYCGLTPRCAYEVEDSGEQRLEKIVRIIAECRFGIHDLSRVELDEGLPRFNMPFELGLFIGAKRYGRGAQDRKSFLIFHKKPYTGQRLISDLQGLDPASHERSPRQLVKKLRDWLSSQRPRRKLPGGPKIMEEYGVFGSWLKAQCRNEQRTRSDLTWTEYVEFAIKWTKERPNSG